MALNNSKFKITSTLTFPNRVIRVQEASFDSYKSFIKLCYHSDQVDFFLQNLLYFIQSHTDATYESLLTLNSLEIMSILLEVRILSLGHAINMSVNVSSDETVRNIAYTKSASKLQSDISTQINTEMIVINDLKIRLKMPFVQSYKDTLYTYNFIDYVEYNNIKYTFIHTLEEEMFYTLPAYSRYILNKAVHKYIEDFKRIMIVEIEGSVEDNTRSIMISLSPTYEFFVYFIKLILNNNLITLHENSFRLSQFANIDLNYINECSPGEALLYMKLLNAAITEKNKQKQ